MTLFYASVRRGNLKLYDKLNENEFLDIIYFKSVFECLQERNTLSTFLLDIDDRLSQFYSPDIFSQYNMFNNHFFERGEHFEEFMKKSKSLLICVDPPFGGIVKLISNTLNQFKNGKLHLIFIVVHA